MKRRSILAAFAALLGLTRSQRGASAEVTDPDLSAEVAGFSDRLCLECGNYTLVPGPPNLDVYKCDCCGAVISGLELVQGRISHTDDEFRFYSGYDIFEAERLPDRLRRLT